MNHNDPLDDNLWKEIFTFLQPGDYRSVLLTCRAWGAFGKDRRLRDAVLSNLTTITAISYTDSTCTTIARKSSVPARDKAWGKMVKIKEWDYPEARAHSTYYNALIIGSEKMITNYHCPGRCDNATIQMDVEGLSYNASSHGTIFVEYIAEDDTRTDISGWRAAEDADRSVALKWADKFLTELGLPTGKQSWAEFWGRDHFYMVIYHPHFLAEKENFNAYHVYQWTSAGMPDTWDKPNH